MVRTILCFCVVLCLSGMTNPLTRIAKRVIGKLFTNQAPLDWSDHHRATAEVVQPFTMTGDLRIGAMIDAVQHIDAAGIAGAIVECGVWRGGSMMAAALTLMQSGKTDRELWLYDTFTGMVTPGEADEDMFGQKAAGKFRGGWCEASLGEVTANMLTTGYPSNRLKFIEGKVEETIPAQAPDKIALLRLDTDWYESTRHELEHLYPRLAAGGILIIDDYGHWKGSRKAVDEYMAKHCTRMFLSRIDYSARIGVKV